MLSCADAQFYAEMCHISGLMNALVPPISEHGEAAVAQEVIGLKLYV